MIDIRDCVNPFGERFNEEHHLTKSLHLYLKEKNYTGAIKNLDDFYNNQKFNCISEFILKKYGYKTSFTPGRMYFPWGDFSVNFKSIDLYERDNRPSRFYGPKSDIEVKFEFWKTLLLLENINSKGFIPDNLGGGVISGVIVESNGRKKYVVLQGNHRLSVLSFLGFKKVPFTHVSGRVAHLSSDRLQSFYLVKNGILTSNEARKLFDLVYFEG